MRIAVIQEELPNTTEGGSGSEVTGWSIVRSLAEAGHEVRLWLLVDRVEGRRILDRRDDRSELERLGVLVSVLETEWGRDDGSLSRVARLARRLISPSLRDFYPGVDRVAEVRALVAKFKPDVVVGFPINAIASTDGLASLPRVVVFGDLDHLIPRFRWRSTPVRPFARFGRATLAVLAARRQWEFSKLLLSRCNRVINLVPHHTRWLQEHGVPSCVHVRIPTVDLAGSEWKRRRQTVRSSRPRILMVGSLSGSATLPGLYLFAHEIIPAIEKSLGPNGFEVHIAGRHEPPADLRALLRRPSIVLRGYVDALTPEFLAADVVLVPTPIEIGIRVRIIVAASYGCCVVAHRANLMGTPEFEHDRDILAADDGRGLAEAVVHALTDAHLRERIGDAARRTYERYFGLDTAGRHLVAEVERAARTP